MNKRFNLASDRVFRGADKFERECNVVVDRSGAQQIEVLKDHANGTANIAKICVAELRQILTVNDDAAAGRAIEQIDAANERALTGAGSTDDAKDFSCADRNRDVLERLEDFTVVADVGLRDVFEFDHEGINGSDISEMSENTNCQQTSRQFVVGESIDWSVLLGAE